MNSVVIVGIIVTVLIFSLRVTSAELPGGRFLAPDEGLVLGRACGSA